MRRGTRGTAAARFCEGLRVAGAKAQDDSGAPSGIPIKPAVSAADREAAWRAWGCLASDFFHSRYAESRDFAGAKVFLARLGELLSHPAMDIGLNAQNQVELGLADLSRSLLVASTACLATLHAGWPSFSASLVHKITEFVENRTPNSLAISEALRKKWTSYLSDSLEHLHARGGT